MNKIILAAAIALATTCGSAAAQTVFFDNFDNETPALNQAPSNWDQVRGTVDIIGNGPNGGPFHDFLPGNGYYVDLDGSTGAAGLISTPISVHAGNLYELSFDLAGSQRGDTNTVTYGIDLNSDAVADFSGSATLLSGQGFMRHSLLFTANGGVRVMFDHAGGDNIGLLLDNVSVAVAIPEPETYALLLAGLGLLGFAARRRVKAEA